MKKIFTVVFASMSVFSLYAAEGAAMRERLHDCDIWLSEKTIEGKTDLYYMVYSTSGVDKGMFIAYANDFETLTKKYDLTAKQLEQIARQQAAHIKNLKNVSQ